MVVHSWLGFSSHSLRETQKAGESNILTVKAHRNCCSSTSAGLLHISQTPAVSLQIPRSLHFISRRQHIAEPTLVLHETELFHTRHRIMSSRMIIGPEPGQCWVLPDHHDSSWQPKYEVELSGPRACIRCNGHHDDDPPVSHGFSFRGSRRLIDQLPIVDTNGREGLGVTSLRVDEQWDLESSGQCSSQSFRRVGDFDQGTVKSCR